MESLVTRVARTIANELNAPTHKQTDTDWAEFTGCYRIRYNKDSGNIAIYVNTSDLVLKFSVHGDSAYFPLEVRLPMVVINALAHTETEHPGCVLPSIAHNAVDESPAQTALSLITDQLASMGNASFAALFSLWQETAERNKDREIREHLDLAFNERDYAQSFGWADRMETAWAHVNRAYAVVA